MNKKIFLILFGILLITTSAFADTYNLSLKAGENLVALPFIPQDTNIATVLSPIISQVKDVWEFNPSDANDPWKHYQPGMEVYSDFSQMDAGKGYWINVKTDVNLPITGTPVSPNYLLSLKTGWNIIGWPYQNTQGITAALVALNFGTDYTQVSKLNSSTKAQENFLNQPTDNFTAFEPGYAYFIYMLQDKTIRIGLSGSVDVTPPTGTISLNNDSQYTNSTSVTLTLSATDPESGMGIGAQMKFSNDGMSWSNPEDYATNKVWTLSSGDDSKTVYVKYKDVAGNWSDVYSDMIILDTIPPQITALNIFDHSKFYENSSIVITPTVNDTDSSPLEYQFSIDDVIKQSWSGLSSYTWLSSSQHIGSHNIKVEVRDTGGQDNKQIGVYILRKPADPPAH